jgi:hypothetical protein
MRSRCTASESKSCRISDATSPATPSHASATTRPACPLRSWPSSPAAVHREAPGARPESDQYPRYMRTARTRLRDLGINRRAATPYAVNGVYKSVTSENPVLEQVTDRLRRLLEELHRVPRLDALREYEHAHFGVFSTCPLRCKRPLVVSGG